MDWTFTLRSKAKLKEPVLITGLPGIGNVGKVAVDFLVDQLEASLLAECFSLSFPNSVFVNEDNLVELPKIELYHKKVKGKDLIFLVGDMQPIDERSTYSFCLSLLDFVKKRGGKQVLTLGGIGLKEVPKKPKIYVTGNKTSHVKKVAKTTKASTDIYGVVGPIVGVTGLLVGLAAGRGFEAACLLVETYNHPLYLGMKEARAIVKAVMGLYKLKVDIEQMDKEIEEVERTVLKKTQGIQNVQQGKSGKRQTSYIG